MKIKNFINKTRNLLNYNFDEIKTNEYELKEELKNINTKLNNRINDLEVKLDTLKELEK